ncbi:MAG TPA: response regulator [Pseudomonas sp.]|uniref:response regulator n=1 Tax=Pseudomonas sp. TaxID=306 RepID=UPI002ED866FC
MTTVLIIDDEYLIVDILSYALEDEGYLTVKAASAQKALDILDRERPQLIITDYMMPGMNGIQLAEQIRQRPGMHATPIILMSGAQAALGKARPDLFSDVLEKPFEIVHVLAAVRRQVN